MTVTETFPSYFLGKNPERRVIAVSYGDALAHRFGRLNREKVRSGVFEIQISPQQSSSTNWGLTGHRGGMISAGVGGPIVGEGADLLLIDDPIKNRQESFSQAYREMIWGEWQNTLLTRLSPAGAVIIILTRWHEDDLVGRILKENFEKWTIVKLPAEAEEEDLLGRSFGEPLWPEYGFDSSWLAEQKRDIGSYAWSALYQQRPSSAEGSILKRDWWKFYRQVPHWFDEMIQSWDMSFKETVSGSYVVGQVWGRVGADKYLLDQVRERADFPTTLQMVRTLSAKWPQAQAKLIEDRANGPAVISTLKREISGLLAVEPSGSKEARASAVSPQIESGNVYLPEFAPWTSDFIEECAAFPAGETDDQVDAMTQALVRLSQASSLSETVRNLFRKSSFTDD